MTPKPLSDNEKKALYGLARFPAFNDRMLSAELGLKMSTVTALRNRLSQEGYYRTIRVPYLERLGGELFIVTWARLGVARPREVLLRALREVLGGMDDVFLAIADTGHLLMLSMCRNYTDAWTGAEKGFQQLADKGVLAGPSSRRQTVIFPLNQTRLLRFFDFSRILGGVLGTENRSPESPSNPKTGPARHRRLSRVEKKVFLGLVRLPDLADNGVGRKIGVTRQSVTRIRKRLEAEGLLSTVRVPDLQKTGLEILALAHYETTPGTLQAARRKGLEWVLREMPVFLHVAGQREGLVLGLAGSFTDLQKHRLEASRMCLEKGLTESEPAVLLMSVPELAMVKYFVFGPLVKRVLQINTEKQQGPRRKGHGARAEGLKG